MEREVDGDQMKGFFTWSSLIRSPPQAGQGKGELRVTVGLSTALWRLDELVCKNLKVRILIPIDLGCHKSNKYSVSRYIWIFCPTKLPSYNVLYLAYSPLISYVHVCFSVVLHLHVWERFWFTL